MSTDILRLLAAVGRPLTTAQIARRMLEDPQDLGVCLSVLERQGKLHSEVVPDPTKPPYKKSGRLRNCLIWSIPDP